MRELFDTCLIMSQPKREEYTSCTGSDIFPWPFCWHWLIEDKKVAESVITLWPNFTKYVNETLKKPTIRIPVCFIYYSEVSCSLSSDGCKTAILHLCSNCDGTMYADILGRCSYVTICHYWNNVFAWELEAKICKAVNSPAKIAKLNISDAADINVGFTATGVLAGLLRQKKVVDLQAFEFRKEYASMLAAIVRKI